MEGAGTWHYNHWYELNASALIISYSNHSCRPGPDIKFYAILCLGTQYRLASLTPALSCIYSASEEGDRDALYRAFTVTLVLNHRIFEDYES
jgi:hypothetical protein